MSNSIQYVPFRIGDTPHCAWGWDLSGQNTRFLNSIDPEYYDYIARTQLPHLETDDVQRAATALRSAYLHGLETFFSLLGASVQAPRCLPGWVTRATTGEIRTVIRQIHRRGRPHCQLPIVPLTWESLSQNVHARLDKPEQQKVELQKSFSELWARFAADFLNEQYIGEYNSFKHGFRARAGGFVLKAGIEPEYGVSPPEEEMSVVGASEFGASFFVIKPIEGAQKRKRRDPHFYIADQSLNWRPEAMVQALQLLAMSINNLVGFLRIVNGQRSSEVRFLNPVEHETFQAPWRWPVGAMSMTMAIPVTDGDIRRFTAEEILQEIEESRPREA